MEKVAGADKGAEAPVIEPNKSGEVSAAKKEDFYTKIQNKMIDLRKQSNIYLNHAPKSEKYGLCQRIRNLEDEIFGLLIDALLWFDKNHCEESYKSEILRRQLPPSMRE